MKKNNIYSISIEKFEDLLKKIGYNFNNVDLLIEAFTHPSMKNVTPVNYERLELLGDTVLSLVIVENLYFLYKDLNEGELSKLKSKLVCSDTLSKVGDELNIGKYIIMSPGEEKTNGRTNKRNIENTIEALIGAIYVDSNLEAAKKFIEKYWKSFMSNENIFEKDPKTRLQEWLQGHNYKLPIYRIIDESRSTPIVYTVALSTELINTTGSANSKKEAEVECAKKMIDYIKYFIDDKI